MQQTKEKQELPLCHIELFSISAPFVLLKYTTNDKSTSVTRVFIRFFYKNRKKSKLKILFF